MRSNSFTKARNAATNEGCKRILDSIRDPLRMNIVMLLSCDKPMNVGQITGRFKVSRPAISHHLKVLKEAGFVTAEKAGQEVYYRLDRARLVAGLREIADAIEQCRHP